jgi:hypothetical protein
MPATIVKDLRTIRNIPRPGEHQLSINLGLANTETVLRFARENGLGFELVQIQTRDGIEIHALLLAEEGVESLPFGSEGSEISDKLDELSSQINPDAIRHVYGKLKAA